MLIKNQVQLITYPDSLGGNLKSLDEILRNHFSDIFKGGVHILPPFPSSADRGFAPTTYFEIEPKFGTWDDMRRIGERAVQATGEGRAINRHNYSASEIDTALQMSVVQRLLKLIRFRNECPAFSGDFSVREANEDELVLAWSKADQECWLQVDLQSFRSVISYTNDSCDKIEYQV